MNPHCVLIVDDDPRYLDVLHAAVEAEGYRVLISDEPRRALSIARESRPHVILTDVAMPGMDGYELAAELAADSRTAAIPVVFMTACMQDTGPRRDYGAGPLRHIMKPFSIPFLMQELQRCIAQSLQKRVAHE